MTLEMALKVGDTAPDFEADDSLGGRTRLSYLRGQWVVLYFYPRAFTPGCTRQAKNFRDNYDDLRALGAEVIGVSTDDAEKQCDFGKSMKARFPLIADQSGEVTRAFDVKWALLPVAKRVTYVIDPDGVVAAVFHHELQVLKHLDDVLRFLRAKVPA
jgi:peroxiredoxin Q/BCP